MNAFLRPLPLVILGCAIARPATAQPPMDLSPAEMMKRADIDGDGKVSRDEFIKSRTARLEENFTRMDTDGDGMLDEREAETAAEQMRAMMGGREGFQRPDGPRPQRPGVERPQRPGGDRPRLPEGEQPARPGGGGFGEQAFDRLDGDGDGKLSRDEFAAGMARMREFMQRGGPGPAGPGGPGRPDRGERGPAEGFRRPPQQE